MGPIVLTFQAFVSFIKIKSKNYVIMKNFDNEKHGTIIPTYNEKIMYVFYLKVICKMKP